MGEETRKEIDRLERRIAELRQRETLEKLNVRAGGSGAPPPMPGVADSIPPLPPLELADSVPPPERRSKVEKASPKPPKRKARKKESKRVEQAVIGLVVIFFGGCMALVATQNASDPSSEKTAKPETTAKSGKAPKPGEDEPAEPPQDDENLAPDPSGVCQQLVAAGVAESCRPPATNGEGERVAVFELGGGAEGRVRTFDSSARCEQASGPGGGHWYARCDALTAIVIPSTVDAADTLAARRVASRL